MLRKFTATMLVFLLFFPLFAQQPNSGKIQLKVLFISGSADRPNESTLSVTDVHPDSILMRANSFKELLCNYFSDVKVLPGNEYTPVMSSKFDVTIFDGPVSALPDKFEYPAIMLVENAATIGKNLGVKHDWFCLCLEDYAYDTNTEHPIFNTPYKVNLTFEEKPLPNAAFVYQPYYDTVIPKTKQMWRVQTLTSQNSKFVRYGLVSRPWGFNDSPDTEYISGGLSLKAPTAVCIGRHGNFFHWGFSASPKYMTDQAKKVFINSVVYTSSLKGQKIIARKYNSNIKIKQELSYKIYSLSDEAYNQSIAQRKQLNEHHKKYVETLKERKAKGDTLSEIEIMHLNMQGAPNKIPSKEEYIKSEMGKEYAIFKGDVKKFKKYLIDNTPYFIANNNYGFDLDEDAKSLKIANTDKAILTKSIALLEKGKDLEKAKRILERYTNCTFETAKEWREWYNSVEDKLFFSQSGGYKWLVNTFDPDEPANNYDAQPIHNAAKAIVLAETDDNEPVSVGATLCKLPGGGQCVIVKMRIHDGYHIYSPIGEQGAFTPTSVKVVLPEGYTAGQMQYPATVMSASGTPEYTGEIIFAQPIYGTDGSKIEVHIKYQCCNPGICLPPAGKNFELKSLY